MQQVLSTNYLFGVCVCIATEAPVVNLQILSVSVNVKRSSGRYISSFILLISVNVEEASSVSTVETCHNEVSLCKTKLQSRTNGVKIFSERTENSRIARTSIKVCSCCWVPTSTGAPSSSSFSIALLASSSLLAGVAASFYQWS
jgi:galactokinase/mevalonate kinase-like predicted kinase